MHFEDVLKVPIYNYPPTSLFTKNIKINYPSYKDQEITKYQAY